MRTLDNWANRLLQVPLLIECPTMRVMGSGRRNLMFLGPGHILIKSHSEIEFVMHGKPVHEEKAVKLLMAPLEKPRVNPRLLKVFAIDYEGVEWNCGLVNVHIGDIARDTWRLSGSIPMLVTEDRGTRVSPGAGVEVIYDAQLDVPFPLNQHGHKPVCGTRAPVSAPVGAHHTVHLDNGVVAFRQEPMQGRLWITASSFKPCLLEFLEDWVGEPLNILLGQLIYPRLIARNHGDGTTTISLRSTRKHFADSKISALLSQHPGLADQRFWEIYELILSMLIRAGEGRGKLPSVLHPLTEYYQEIAQATTGSHWVLCMTLASVIEGVANLAYPRIKYVTPPDDEIDAWETSIRSLKAHIKQWRGDRKLLQRIMGSLQGAREKGVVNRLQPIVESGLVADAHLETWRSVRNSVMHGNLVSPWPRDELGRKLKLLIELAHRLSETYIRECAKEGGVVIA